MNCWLFQINVLWEDKERNLAHINELINNANIQAGSLIILPEMFITGFTMNASSVAEDMKGETISWMRNTATILKSAICGSLVVKENNQYFNRFIFAHPTGNIDFYDKRHLFRMSEEHENFSSGSNRKIIHYNGIRILPLICYDLRFPVWSRNQNDYDLIIYSASWPKSRKKVWNTLLSARAIENQSFVIGVNRVGFDNQNTEMCGNSQAIDYKGHVVSKLSTTDDTTVHFQLNIDPLVEFRNKFPAWKDADKFKIL